MRQSVEEYGIRYHNIIFTMHLHRVQCRLEKEHQWSSFDIEVVCRIWVLLVERCVWIELILLWLTEFINIVINGYSPGWLGQNAVTQERFVVTLEYMTIAYQACLQSAQWHYSSTLYMSNTSIHKFSVEKINFIKQMIVAFCIFHNC